MTTQPNSDRDESDKIALQHFGLTDVQISAVMCRFSLERAAKDAEIAHWKQRFEWLANDALTALAGHTPTPVETYKDAPHCLSGDIRRLIQEKEAEIQQLKAEIAALKAGDK